jgi:hypothetical protein
MVLMNWVKHNFIPKKEAGKYLLVFDLQGSHCSDVNVFDFAAEDNVILLCLPGHIPHYFQALDCYFVKPLETFWQRALKNWIYRNTGRKIT